ncbi:TonB-dependent receptor [Nitrospirillum sp. BR 11163]|uniref:TonB-dependent receptor n=1 Tax=Nitrospirillum sp. BR 11163 TaxID=3104323 RepID=UPI002AFDE01B|nr:TonB-dependent receptor [Nitrospirillum sp. BR 11163]MEA1673944.1 TonB-dependent receptor [Nitrospirillum sp. BR 11163]
MKRNSVTSPSTRRHLAGGAAALALAALAAVAPGARPAQAQQAAPQSSPGGDKESAALDEIVVTALRRRESLQSAPVAVTAVTGEALERQGMNNVADLQKQVAGLQISYGGAVADVYLRGVGNFATDQYAESAIAMNVDGVYIAKPAGFNGFFFDIDRVEVLKGPQGTLYGRNASGGAINVITRKPDTDGVGGEAGIEFGSYDLVKANAALNVPLNDKVAVRGSVMVSSHSGYLSDGYDDDKTQAARVQVLAKPDDVTSILASVDYSHLGGKGAGTILLNQNGKVLNSSDPWMGASTAQANAFKLAQNGAPQLPVQDTGWQNIRNMGASVDFERDLGFANLTFIPAVRYLMDDYYTWVPGFSDAVTDHTLTSSVEARLSSEDDSWLKWVAGLYFFDEDDKSHFRVNQLVNLTYANFPELKTRSYAAFGDVTAPVTESFRLIGGLRYTIEDKSQHAVDYTGFPGNVSLPSFTLNGNDPLAGLTPAEHIGATTYYAFNWKAGFQYDLNPKSMVYFTASTGFKSGGYILSDAPYDRYAPEKLTAFELGSKNRFFDDRLQLNLEAFYWKYKNHQETLFGPVVDNGVGNTGRITVNAGDATIKGFDVSTKYKLTPRDMISADVEYLDSIYDSFSFFSWLNGGSLPFNTTCKIGASAVRSGVAGRMVDCSGRGLIRAPKWTGTLGYEHDFDLADGAVLAANIDSQFSSGYYWGMDFIAAEYQGGYTTTNISLTYTAASGGWSATGYVNNVEDAVIFTGGNQDMFKPGIAYTNIRPPRTFGVRGKVSF